MPTRGLVGCTTCKKYMSVSGVLIRLWLHVPDQYPDGYELLHHSSMGKLFPSECVGPVFDSDPSRLTAPSRSGRNRILAQSLFKKEIGHLAPEPFFFLSFFLLLLCVSPLRLSSLRLAFAPLIFASRLCASHLCVSPLRPSHLCVSPSRLPLCASQFAPRRSSLSVTFLIFLREYLFAPSLGPPSRPLSYAQSSL